MPAKTATANGVKPALLDGGLDLDALLAARRLDPMPVRLGGHVYQVRRDLTAAECDEFETELRKGRDGDLAAFTLILGAPDAARFLEVSRTLPREHETLATQKIVVAAGLRSPAQFGFDQEDDGEGGEQGESAAS